MNREDFFVTYALAEITSSETFRIRDGTVASSPPGCRVRYPEQLLMLT